MRYTEEFDAETFQFWTGGLDTVNAIREAGKVEDFQLMVEEHFRSTFPSKTQVNDFAWFNRSEILKALGIAEEE